MEWISKSKVYSLRERDSRPLHPPSTAKAPPDPGNNVLLSIQINSLVWGLALGSFIYIRIIVPSVKHPKHLFFSFSSSQRFNMFKFRIFPKQSLLYGVLADIKAGLCMVALSPLRNREKMILAGVL